MTKFLLGPGRKDSIASDNVVYIYVDQMFDG